MFPVTPLVYALDVSILGAITRHYNHIVFQILLTYFVQKILYLDNSRKNLPFDRFEQFCAFNRLELFPLIISKFMNANFEKLRYNIWIENWCRFYRFVFGLFQQFHCLFNFWLEFERIFRLLFFELN